VPRIDQVKWGEDNSIDVAPTLTEEEAQSLKERMQAFDKVLADQQIAKYKIEVFFTHKRSGHAPHFGAIYAFESGTKLHGGGDEKIYFCPAGSFGRPPCDGVMGGKCQGYGFLTCPKCGQTWRDAQVWGELMGNWTTQQWAEKVHRFFVILGHNADVYVKVPKVDIRKVAELEQQKQYMGEKLFTARDKRDKYIYPLKNILRDTANGSDLLSRFKALLSA